MYFSNIQWVVSSLSPLFSLSLSSLSSLPHLSLPVSLLPLLFLSPSPHSLLFSLSLPSNCRQSGRQHLNGAASHTAAKKGVHYGLLRGTMLQLQVALAPGSSGGLRLPRAPPPPLGHLSSDIKSLLLMAACHTEVKAQASPRHACARAVRAHHFP